MESRTWTVRIRKWEAFILQEPSLLLSPFLSLPPFSYHLSPAKLSAHLSPPFQWWEVLNVCGQTHFVHFLVVSSSLNSMKCCEALVDSWLFNIKLIYFQEGIYAGASITFKQMIFKLKYFLKYKSPMMHQTQHHKYRLMHPLYWHVHKHVWHTQWHFESPQHKTAPCNALFRSHVLSFGVW